MADASRAAIKGGIDAEDALSLSDEYIRKCELMTGVDSIVNLQYHMVLDYTRRVERIKIGILAVFFLSRGLLLVPLILLLLLVLGLLILLGLLIFILLALPLLGVLLGLLPVLRLLLGLLGLTLLRLTALHAALPTVLTVLFPLVLLGGLRVHVLHVLALTAALAATVTTASFSTAALLILGLFRLVLIFFHKIIST